nr:terpene synthase 24 [Aquilaria agallochum]
MSSSICSHVSVAAVAVTLPQARLLRSVATNAVARASCGGGRRHKLRSVAALKTSSDDKKLVQQSADDNRASIWSNDYIQSMESKYSGEANTEHINKLKEDARTMLKKAEDEPLINQLELIDLLERLGISYHFEDEIQKNLERISQAHSKPTHYKDLYGTSLEFKLLRQHGYKVTSDVFKAFKDDKSGQFKASLGKDCKGLLNLYEASFLAVEGENILEEARSFSKKYLSKQKKDGTFLSLLVAHALELALHWRMPRMEARWFIDLYEQCQYMNPVLLHFAKLDFNIVQATHQQDLKFVSRWWMNTGLGQNLNFIRDKMIEHFLWTIGLMYEPQHGYFRRVVAQLVALITTIDDIYDTYGTLDQLQLFTDAVVRLDINEVDRLSDNYMKMSLFALHNSVSEMAAKHFKDQEVNVLPFIKKAWIDLSEAYLVEAKWYNTGYVPTMQEYINNATISVAAPLTLCYAYILLSNPLSKDTLYNFHQYSIISHCPSLITRLTNDLGTSLAQIRQVDVPKSIECYVHDNGCSEDEAREHVKGLIEATWKKMNKAILESPLTMPNKTFHQVAMNLARMSQFMYLHSDGHSFQDFTTYKNDMLSLLANPFEI